MPNQSLRVKHDIKPRRSVTRLARPRLAASCPSPGQKHTPVPDVKSGRTRHSFQIRVHSASQPVHGQHTHKWLFQHYL